MRVQGALPIVRGTRVRFEGWIDMLSELLDKEEFFKKQSGECRGLAQHAINADDRIFWEQAAKYWSEQLRAAKRGNRPKRQTGRVASNGTSEAKACQQEPRQPELRASRSTHPKERGELDTVTPRSSSFFLQIGALARRLASAF